MILKNEKTKKWSKIKGFLELEKSEIYTCIQEWAEKWIKIADEAEYEITDVESFSSVLEKYWMRKIREKKKFRISYKLWEVEFDIDKYDEIPTLIEIEAKSKEEIKYFISVLWFDNHTVKKFGSRKLYKHYNKEYLYIK